MAKVAKVEEAGSVSAACPPRGSLLVPPPLSLLYLARLSRVPSSGFSNSSHAATKDTQPTKDEKLGLAVKRGTKGTRGTRRPRQQATAPQRTLSSPEKAPALGVFPRSTSSGTVVSLDTHKPYDRVTAAGLHTSEAGSLQPSALRGTSKRPTKRGPVDSVDSRLPL